MSTEPHGRDTRDWPRRVAVEIVEHQWNHGILITRIPDWDNAGTFGFNQEDVPWQVWDQPVGTIVHVVLYTRDELEPDEPTWPEFRDWEWPGGSEATPTNPISVPREDLRALFDVAVGSMNFTSGFLDTDEVNMLRRVAILIAVDPMNATPSEFRRQYKHSFKAYVDARHGPTKTCYWCSQPADVSVHQGSEAPRG